MRSGDARCEDWTLCRWRWTLLEEWEKGHKHAISIVMANARIYRGNALYDRNVSRRGLTQRMQVAVMRGVARQLLRRLAVAEEEEGEEVGWQEGR